MVRTDCVPRSMLTIAALAMVTMSAACGSPAATPPAATPAASPTTEPRTITEPYAPDIDPAAFSTTVDNPFFPLVPGTRTIYDATTEDGRQRTITEVTRDTKKVMGVDAVVVHDSVYLDGGLLEDTFDWYAQDRDGNVWYFGEATTKFDAGSADTTGSFESGINGALPGIAMPAKPQVGDRYRQEYAKAIAEDTGEVLDLAGRETTPLTGPVTDLLVTKDVNPLDPESAIENKYYARGVGLVLTLHVTGPAERDEAVTTEKF